MKKTLLAAAALASLGSSAFAQSAVTIYGRLNLSIERQEPASGDTNWVMQNSTSRWGLKGVEDLGGGLKAGFQLPLSLEFQLRGWCCACRARSRSRATWV